MKRTNVSLSLAALLAVGIAGAAMSVAAEDDITYGRELMTEQERAEHRERLRSMETEAEREAYRKEQHERMQERAREQGEVLPDEPQQRGTGMGYGSRDGSGGGMGQGGGAGRR